MNIERLHRILMNLNEDLTSSNVIKVLNNVQAHLQNMVQQPAQAQHQTNFVKTREVLYKSLGQMNYNQYSNGWKQTINEIGGEGLLGQELNNQLQEIFDRNNMTPANASEEFKALNSLVGEFNASITSMLTGMESLNIGSEKLEPGECELGYSIPRLFTKNKLSSFESEVGELNFILNNVSEVVTGSKQDIELKTISSSEFLIYIILGLEIADVLGSVVERILNSYKSILEIKILNKKMLESGVPKDTIKPINEYANGMMQAEIKKIAKEVVDNHYKGDNGRKNELENGLTFSFNKLANRIDNGFQIEIRVEPLPPTENEEKPSKTILDKMGQIESIQKTVAKIEHIDTGGESILKLPEKNNKKK